MFFLFSFYKTPLFVAAEKGNLEITKLLLEHPEIEINKKTISNQYLLIKQF